MSGSNKAIRFGSVDDYIWMNASPSLGTFFGGVSLKDDLGMVSGDNYWVIMNITQAGYRLTVNGHLMATAHPLGTGELKAERVIMTKRS